MGGYIIVPSKHHDLSQVFFLQFLGSADDAPGKSAAGHHGVRWGICSSLHLQARVQKGWKRVRQENHGVPERIKHGNGRVSEKNWLLIIGP